MNARKKKLLGIVIILLVFIEVISLFFTSKALSNKETKLENVKYNIIEKNNMFAIYLQSGDTYIESVNNTWPSVSDYEFNSTLSGCVDLNGEKIENVLSYSNGIATLETEKTVSCYMYFDEAKVQWKKYGAQQSSTGSYQYTQHSGSNGTTAQTMTLTSSQSATIVKSYMFNQAHGFASDWTTKVTLTYNIGNLIAYVGYYINVSPTAVYQITAITPLINDKWSITYSQVAYATSTYVPGETTYIKGLEVGTVSAKEGEQPEAGTIVQGDINGDYVVIMTAPAYWYWYERVV